MSGMLMENESCGPGARPASPISSFERRNALAWGPIGGLLLSVLPQELGIVAPTVTRDGGGVSVTAGASSAEDETPTNWNWVRDADIPINIS
jgi:hypothetical protein